MRAFTHYRTLIGLIVLLALVVLGTIPTLHAQDDPPPMLFDDFTYTAHDDPLLGEHGWIVRDGDGWPGVEGAIWRAENVSFAADPDDEANTLLLMTSSTDGTDTYQTQVCHQRKYYEGTYAARVWFSNEPASGPDGDRVVQTFYLISPQQYDLDPDYSEMDWEYLPNGGWGAPEHTLFATTWETFQLDPWQAINITETMTFDFAGWHTLVIHVAEGSVTYFIDGKEYALHDGEYYPEVPLSINFNHWFINGGLLRSDEPRDYVEQVDWVFFAQDVVLDPDAVAEQIAAFREDETLFIDTVPDWDPPLESPCNF